MQKHVSKIASCRLRSEASLAQADFIAARCQEFRLVCVHSPSEDAHTEVITPSIHVYQEDLAKQQFGDTGWVEVYRPTDSAFKNDPPVFCKLVSWYCCGELDKILVSYDHLDSDAGPDVQTQRPGGDVDMSVGKLSPG